METLRDEAIVLRTQDLNEADHIAMLLSANNGLVRAVAHGVRRTTSRIGAHLEPFRVVDVLIRPGCGGLHNVEQVETLAPYGRLTAADHTLFTTTNLIVEVLERLSEGAWTTDHYHRLTLGVLHALVLSHHEPELVLDSYPLRLLGLAGWAASCWNCAACGAGEPHQYFSPAAGGAVCGGYKPYGAAPMTLETMHLLAALSVGDWPRAKASGVAEHVEAHSLVTAFVQWHVERRLKSLAIPEITQRLLALSARTLRARHCFRVEQSDMACFNYGK